MTDRLTNVGDVLASGTRIEEFAIERELRSGGFGVTYLARDRSLGRVVAIKEYLPREWGGRRADGAVGPRSASCAEDYRWGLTRFLDEARILARLDHARIVRVYRVIEARGTAYMVMEYVEGRNLEETLEAEGPWPEARVRALLEALLPGLATVHEAGLLHRDIKPSNVMLRADGTPVLIDFGAARYAAGAHSRSLTSVLTPGYAPHEQYQSAGKQGPWTDIYALGAVAYRALTGRPPAEATERVDSIARGARADARAHRNPDPLPPVSAAAAGTVSDAFGAAMTAALSVWPEDRPRDVAAWRALWDAGEAAGPVAGFAGRTDETAHDDRPFPRVLAALALSLRKPRQKVAQAVDRASRLIRGRRRNPDGSIDPPPSPDHSPRPSPVPQHPVPAPPPTPSPPWFAPAFDGSGLERCAEPGGFVLGRDGTLVDAVVDHRSVSRRHVRLTRLDGRLRVEDLNSTNGTRVNGRRLEPFAPCVLATGDAVVLGDVHLALAV